MFVRVFYLFVWRALGSGLTLKLRLASVQADGTEPTELGSVSGSRARCSANGTRALCRRYAKRKKLKASNFY